MNERSNIEVSKMKMSIESEIIYCDNQNEVILCSNNISLLCEVKIHTTENVLHTHSWYDQIEWLCDS